MAVEIDIGFLIDEIDRAIELSNVGILAKTDEVLAKQINSGDDSLNDSLKKEVRAAIEKLEGLVANASNQPESMPVPVG